MTNTNSETALPAVPEGYFWRVSRDFLGVFYRVQLRKKNRLFGSHVVEWTAGSIDELNEAEIRYCAEYVLEEWKQGPSPVRRDLLGDYFPKKKEHHQ